MANTSQNQAQYLYKIGDFVYFETSATQPYQIRRIEELQKLPNNQVEAKVTCFFRRRDLSSQLLHLADKHNLVADGPRSPPGAKTNDSAEEPVVGVQNSSTTETNGTDHSLTPKQRHQLKHRELFMSRQVETLSATLIRGKCSVMLLNETEAPSVYLQRSDAFYYRLVYDPDVKTLLADRGEIRVGPKYQVALSQLQELNAHAPKLSGTSTDEQKANEGGDGPVPESSEQVETPLWLVDQIDNHQLDQFVTIVKSVGAYARALDVQSAAKHSSLQLSAAAASRDITSQAAFNILHEAGYKVEAALSRLLPASGPLLCRDEMEGWTAQEVQLFETALEKCGKDFGFIRSAYLPWKSMRSVIEYYYFWKTTDRYVQQRRAKALESSRKLTTFYVAPFNKPSPALLAAAHQLNAANPKPCESCCAQTSSQWYAFGPAQQTRICGSCWSYWKRYGGLKLPTRLDGERPTPRGRQERIAEIMLMNSTNTTPSRPSLGSPQNRTARQRAGTADPADRTSGGSSRSSFCMQVTPLGRLARVVCDSLVRSHKMARAPTRTAVAAKTIEQSLTTQLDALAAPDRTRLFDAARDRERDRLARAALAVREMMRLHPYFRATPNESDSAAQSMTASLDSATKRCTKSSPVKCALSDTNGHEPSGNAPNSDGTRTPQQLANATISRRSANKLTAHPSIAETGTLCSSASLDSATKRCTKSSPVKCALGTNDEPSGAIAQLPNATIGRRSANKLNAVAKMSGTTNGGDDEERTANGDGDRLRVGVSTTGITRKRVRDSLTSPNEPASPTNRSLDADQRDTPAKRWRGDAQLLVTKTDRGVMLRVVAPASGIDAAGSLVFAKYRECIDLVNENERVVWEPSWYMRAMSLVRRVRSQCTDTQLLRRLGRKWTQHAFDLPAASASSKTPRDDADAAPATKGDSQRDTNDEPVRLEMVCD